MEIMGRPIGAPRKPLQKTDAARLMRIKEDLDKFGILSEEPYGW
jgi:hypothetical protein